MPWCCRACERRRGFPAFISFFFFGFLFFGKPAHRNGRLLQVMVVLALVCVWLFWVCTYMSQLNPLIGPEVKVKEYFLKPTW